MKAKVVMSPRGPIRLGHFDEVLSIPDRYLNDHCLVHDGDRHGWWTRLVTSRSPFDFSGGDTLRLGYCHASEVFHWQDRWWITHCSGDPDDYLYRRSNRTRGLFLGNLEWPEGEYPRLI